MKPRVVEGLDPAAPLRPNAERIVRTRLEELRSLAPAALEAVGGDGPARHADRRQATALCA